MPVEFLTHNQEKQYGKFTYEPTPEQLAKYFLLDDKDTAIILKQRSDHNRLDFAVQLGTVRFLGTFLVDSSAVPENVFVYISQQLGINIQDTPYLKIN